MASVMFPMGASFLSSSARAPIKYLFFGLCLTLLALSVYFTGTYWGYHNQPLPVFTPYSAPSSSPAPSTQPTPTTSFSQLCLKEGTTLSLTYQAALAIASQSPCLQVGTLLASYTCNQTTGTWWFGLQPFTPKTGCNPACVVDLATHQAQVNWRCTGLLQL